MNYKLYVPKDVKISYVRKESESVKTYRLKIDREFRPGQFFQVSVLGAGEAPISASSSPTEKHYIELTVRNVGKVTRAIHNLTRDDSIGLRGPFGNFFKLEEMTGRDSIFVAGGIGLAPLRSCIRYIQDNRKRYGQLHLLYGARTYSDIIFKDDLEKWQKIRDFNILLTIDRPERNWQGNVGVVTTLFDRLKIDLKDFVAFVCGPPIMIRYTIFKLVELGLDDREIFVTLERYMKCGVGKCGHCYINDKYVCIDGPVFSFKQLKEMQPEEVMA